VEQKFVHSLAKQLKCHRLFTDAVIIVLGTLTTISISKLKSFIKFAVCKHPWRICEGQPTNQLEWCLNLLPLTAPAQVWLKSQMQKLFV